MRLASGLIAAAVVLLAVEGSWAQLPGLPAVTPLRALDVVAGAAGRGRSGPTY